MDAEAVRAAEQAMLEAGFGFTVVLETPAPAQVTATPAASPPLAA